jgi:hypothetical protein
MSAAFPEHPRWRTSPSHTGHRHFKITTCDFRRPTTPQAQWNKGIHEPTLVAGEDRSISRGQLKDRQGGRLGQVLRTDAIKTSEDIEWYVRICFVSIPYARCAMGAVEYLRLPVSMLAYIVFLVVGGSVPPGRDSRTAKATSRPPTKKCG